MQINIINDEIELPPHWINAEPRPRHSNRGAVRIAFTVHDYTSNFPAPNGDVDAGGYDYLRDPNGHTIHEVEIIRSRVEAVGANGAVRSGIMHNFICDCPDGMDAGRCWHVRSALLFMANRIGGEPPNSAEEYREFMERYVSRFGAPRSHVDA